MGKVLIVGGGAAGSYQVQRVLDDSTLVITKADLQKAITRLMGEITELQAQLPALIEVYESAMAAYLLALELYIAAIRAAADTGTPATDVYGYTKKWQLAEKAARELNETKQLIATNELTLANAQTELAELEALENPAAEAVWCADYTENAGGTVASIEVPGEPQQLILYPQGRAEGAYQSARDGALMPREWMTPEQAYFNAAILPGWQKFKPTVRVAVISGINYDSDTATVTLISAYSSAAALPINQQEIYSGVPIEYMNCNANAFTAGDRVLVEFQAQDHTNPRVIGFESNPEPCIDWPLYISSSVSGGSEQIASPVVYRHFYDTLGIIGCWERLVECGDTTNSSSSRMGHSSKDSFHYIWNRWLRWTPLSVSGFTPDASSPRDLFAQTETLPWHDYFLTWSAGTLMDIFSTMSKEHRMLDAFNVVHDGPTNRFAIMHATAERETVGGSGPVPTNRCLLDGPGTFQVADTCDVESWSDEIVTIPRFAGNEVLVDTTDGAASAAWLVAQGAPDVIVLTHTATGRQKSYNNPQLLVSSTWPSTMRYYRADD